MKVLDFLKNNIVILDGGMGTLLQEEGLAPGELPERWNISHPEVIRDIHQRYYDAGSNIVNTNTFGANSLKFDDKELEEILVAAVDNANYAKNNSKNPKEKYVALDIGPLGKLLAPLGTLDFEEAVSIFAKTIKIGSKLNIDLIFIETMNDSYETKAALLAAKENSDLPVFVSNAYGEDGKLMTGATPAAMVALLEGMGADAIGTNCSLGPKQLMGVVDEYLKYASVPVLLKPNAGLPRVENKKTVYDVLPEEFSNDVALALEKGVRIAGGCCGTTPDYIEGLSKKANAITPKPIEKKNITMISSYTHAVVFDKEPILIGERINPTGKSKLKEALRNEDIAYIIEQGIEQQELNVHVLDVNVGLPEIDEPKMLEKVCGELSAVSNLPLQIDTTNEIALERVLRRYNGKAMVNSVNGKESEMKKIFPLVKKYGGLLVCLTLDEDGIPDNSKKRIEIAEKIIKKAAEYGIDKKDLIFDTLAMTVSVDGNAAIATLDALKCIKNNLGCHTSLGISNVSFGLPQRPVITSTFFTMALENGLSAAIMNPRSTEMMQAYYSYRALKGLDENCEAYINNVPGLVEKANETTSTTASTIKKDAPQKETSDELTTAVIKGLKAQAKTITENLIKNGEEPLDIVSNKVMPALDIVGENFEKGSFFLPQLLMSAEAAKESFEIIKAKMKESASKTESKGTFVIATVEGDIHDIGKNIVKLLLENYGFEVVDLGKDVPPGEIVDTVLKTHAPLVGLSALMTTTVPSMEETIKQLKEKAPWVKTCVGGAVLTQKYADDIGADFYGKDAMATVKYAMKVVNDENN